MSCPFCSPASDAMVHEDELVRVLWDGYPVAEGHALVTTKRHIGFVPAAMGEGGAREPGLGSPRASTR